MPFGTIGKAQGWDPLPLCPLMLLPALSLSRGALPWGQVHLLPDGGPGPLLLHPWLQQALLRILRQENLFLHWLAPRHRPQRSPTRNRRSQPHSAALPASHRPCPGGTRWGPHSGSSGCRGVARQGAGSQVTHPGPTCRGTGEAFRLPPSLSLSPRLFLSLPPFPAMVFVGGAAGSPKNSQEDHFFSSRFPHPPSCGVFGFLTVPRKKGEKEPKKESNSGVAAGNPQ